MQVVRAWAVAAVMVVSATTAPAFAQPSDAEMAQREAQCSKGDTQVCQRLGAQYELGLYTAKDLAKARSAYERGCKPADWTTGSSCSTLYRMLSLGEGGPKDPARARVLEPTVCNSGIAAQEVALESVGLCKK